MIQISLSPLILVDGFSYLYRAHYTFPFLVNKNMEPTGAIYGTLNMLRNLMTKYKPTHIGVIFDKKEKNFRKKLYKYYKFYRPPMPNNLCVQIEPLFKIIKAMGLPVISISGVEADDVIGTIAKKAEKIGYLVLIRTDDKDLAQLVTSNIFLIDTKNTILGPKEVTSKYGVEPKLIVDFLSLVGDPSDNIPGVPGIGKKTAKVLLEYFGGLNFLYSNLEKIPKVLCRNSKIVIENLKKNRKMIYFFNRLITLKTDVEINFFYEKLEIKKPKIKELTKLFERYEFNRWKKEIELGKWLKKH